MGIGIYVFMWSLEIMTAQPRIPWWLWGDDRGSCLFCSELPPAPVGVAAETNTTKERKPPTAGELGQMIVAFLDDYSIAFGRFQNAIRQKDVRTTWEVVLGCVMNVGSLVLLLSMIPDNKKPIPEQKAKESSATA